MKYALHFQGYDLLSVVEKSAYRVKIGEAFCSHVDVKMNSISCLPPESKPKDPLHHNTRVRVRFDELFSI